MRGRFQMQDTGCRILDAGYGIRNWKKRGRFGKKGIRKRVEYFYCKTGEEYYILLKIPI